MALKGEVEPLERDSSLPLRRFVFGPEGSRRRKRKRKGKRKRKKRMEEEKEVQTWGKRRTRGVRGGGYA